VTKFLDLFAVLIVALLLLLPQPGVVVFQAVQGDKTDLDRLAVLEDARYRAPNDANAAVDLARAYLRVEQPGWAVAALQPFFGHGDYQVHQVAAYAYATLLMPKEALRQAEQGLNVCEARGPQCPDVARIRLQYLAELMRKPAGEGVDPALDPLRAKELVRQALRATKSGVAPGSPTVAPSPQAPAPQAPAPQGPPTPAPAPKAPTVAPAPQAPPAQPAPQPSPSAGGGSL
jgi:hypothetical protein